MENSLSSFWSAIVNDQTLFLLFIFSLSPIFIAFSRKNNNPVGVIISNLIMSFLFAFGYLLSSIIIIVISVVLWLIIAGKVMSCDNRYETIRLRTRLKSIDYCQECSRSVPLVKRLYKNEDWSVFDKMYDLLTKKSRTVFAKEYKNVIAYTDSMLCKKCSKKVRNAFIEHLKEFIRFDFDFDSDADSDKISGTIIGEQAQNKECPFCCEIITANAQKCPFCAENLE